MRNVTANRLRWMKMLLALCALSMLLGISAQGQTVRNSVSSQCSRENLMVKQTNTDAAMGGVRTIDYSFTNKSSSLCTLKGYPRYEFLDKLGRRLRRGRAVNSEQLPGDETKYPPQLVTLAPGKTAWFRVYYNAGGAGYTGKPCPVARRVGITAPGTTRSFVLRDEITYCANLQVSTVRSGQPQ